MGRFRRNAEGEEDGHPSSLGEFDISLFASNDSKYQPASNEIRESQSVFLAFLSPRAKYRADGVIHSAEGAMEKLTFRRCDKCLANVDVSENTGPHSSIICSEDGGGLKTRISQNTLNQFSA